MWDIQDSLLQSYRNLFLSSQSVLFGIAVFVAQGRLPALSLLLGCIAFPLLILWRGITRSRGYDVFFFHLRLLRLEAGETVEQDIFTAFKRWQRQPIDERLSKIVSDPRGKELIDSKTRVRLDWHLPIAFGVCWGFLCVISIWLSLH